MPATDFELAGARVVIQGFGAVGMHTARFLAERGAVVIAASDSNGAVLNDGGLDVAALGDAKRQGQAVADFPGGEALDRDAVIDVDCEIWVPAARPDVIDMGNVDRLRTKLVPQGANIPITTEAE